MISMGMAGQTSSSSELAESLGRNPCATHTVDLVPGASDTEAPSAEII